MAEDKDLREENELTPDSECPEQETDGAETSDQQQGPESSEETAVEVEEEAAECGEETPDAEGSEGDDPESGKKGLFGRKKKDDKAAKQAAALQTRVDELEDRVKRQMAEFENFRKRSEKEKAQMFSMGESNVLEKMLPVLDNFERGFDTVAPEDEQDAFVDGMRKIYAQLLKQMEDLGVKPIEALGEEFDPNYHNAVMQVDSDEYESGKVGMELLKGYMYHDTVLRHSMVGVVK